MKLSQEQLKGRIKNISQKNKCDPRVLLRIYMMERFIKRVSDSSYKHQFILKGGMLITSMLGISSRSTMDIDMSIKRHGLNSEDIEKAIK